MNKNGLVNSLAQPSDAMMKGKQQLNGCRIAHVVVGMDRSGIAAGAQETLQAILRYAVDMNLNRLVVSMDSCEGWCEHEPIVQVRFGHEPYTTYRKVTPEIAQRILKEHIGCGNVLKEYLIDPQ